MSSIVRVFNHYVFLLRYHWDYYQSRRRMRNFKISPKRFPHDWLINDLGESSVTDKAVILEFLQEDVEGLGIGPIKVFTDIGLVARESLMGPITYHGDIVAWCVTERCQQVDADASESSRSSNQSPSPQSSRRSSLADDVSRPLPSNTHPAPASEMIIFRSTWALAKKYVEKSTFQCTFVPNTNSPHSLIKFILICHSANKFSLENALLEKNYYVAVVVKLLKEFVGGEIEYSRDSSLGKNGGSTIMDSEVAKVAEEIKSLYESVYAEFMESRARLRQNNEMLAHVDNMAQALSVSRDDILSAMEDPDISAAIARLLANKNTVAQEQTDRNV